MTLTTRNRFLMALNIFSFVCFVVLLVASILFLTSDGLSSVPKTLIRNFSLGSSLFFEFSPLATILSLLVLPFYVSVFGFFAFLSFEKTKSSEIVYLSLFFLGCTMQSISVFIPIFSLWDMTSKFLLFIAKIHLAGELISSVSIFLVTMFIGAASSNERITTTDRNVGIAVSLALFCTSILPLNTTKITSCFWVKTGFDTELFVLLYMVLIICVIVFSVYSIKNGYKFFRGPVPSIILFLFGYVCITQVDCWFFFALSVLTLFLGTYGFFRFLRQKYLWN